MRTELPKNVYIVYSAYEDGSKWILSFEYDKDEAVEYCRRMQAKMECRIYVREYSNNLVEYIIDNDDDLGDCDLREILDADYEEDEDEEDE